MILVPNTSYGQKKGVKSSIERKSEKYYQNPAEDREEYTYRKGITRITYNNRAVSSDRPNPSWKVLQRVAEPKTESNKTFDTRQEAFNEANRKAEEEKERYKNRNIRLELSTLGNTITLSGIVWEMPTREESPGSQDIGYVVIEYEVYKK